MKKQIFIITFIAFTFLVNAQDNNEPIVADFTGKLTIEEVKFMKNNYDWHSEKILVINYKQPRSYCHFDNHKHFKNGGRWFKKFYSKINLENCKNIFVCSKHKKSTWFYDVDSFLLNNFFSRKQSCFAVLVINVNGDYIQLNGHYSEENVSNYIDYLKSIL